MSQNLYLTDEKSDITGYLRAKLGTRSDCCSLVRAVTATAAGPSAGIQATRSSGGTALAWITDPLGGIALTASAWTARLWAYESNAAANAALRLQVLPYTTAEGAALLDHNPGTELPTAMRASALTTGAATATTLNPGDRLVIKVLIDDAGTLAAGYTATLAYNGERPRAEGDSVVICPDALTPLAQFPDSTEERIRRAIKQFREDAAMGAGEIARDDVIQAAEAALRTYTRDSPRIVSAALSGDGSAYDFPLPAAWIAGTSRLLGVEYPAGEQVPLMVDPNEVAVREGTLGGQPTRLLRFLATTPSSGTDNIVVTYTTRHVHTTEEDSVPADDLDAVCWLAASNLAQTMAAKRADSSDPSLHADAVNHRDAEQRWAAVAKRLAGMYQQHLGIGAEVAPAAGVIDLDVNSSWGKDRLLHPRRLR